MSQAPVAIPRPLVVQLLHQAQLQAQQEVCGLIGAKNGRPCSCYPIENVSPTPTERYLMDAQQQIQAMSKMREAGEQLFAIYHSHPDTQAQPSASDLELANYPEVFYLIISLQTKGVLEMRGFKLPENQPAEEILLVLEDEDA